MDAAARPGLGLGDPDSFVHGAPHELLAEARRSDPVCWQPMDGHDGFFAVLTYADVLTVSREPVLFSASTGGIMLEDSTPEALAMSRDMLVVMDPPRHTNYRKPVVPSFKPRVIAGMEAQVRAICREIMQEAREAGPDVEFVHQVSALMPSRVMGQLMGLPESRLALRPSTFRADVGGTGPGRGSRGGRSRFGHGAGRIRDELRGLAAQSGTAR